MVDLDGDGRNEILFTPLFASDVRNPSAIYCFSSEGRLLWRYAAQFRFRFGQRDYEGPWEVSDMALISETGRTELWVSFVHVTWWPSVVVRIDTQGRGDLKLVQAGWVMNLASLRTPKGHIILAGGVNNEFDAGSLAVLRADQKAATSPQTPASPYHCADCPANGPEHYWVFPRSELNRVESAPHNHVQSFIITESGFEVRTRETHLRPGFSVEGVFEFSNEFELIAASVTDKYHDFHRLMEREGRIQHSLADCPEETSPRRVRLWTPEHGWTEIIPATK